LYRKAWRQEIGDTDTVVQFLNNQPGVPTISTANGFTYNEFRPCAQYDQQLGMMSSFCPPEAAEWGSPPTLFSDERYTNLQF
jgi:hypothetical protein